MLMPLLMCVCMHTQFLRTHKLMCPVMHNQVCNQVPKEVQVDATSDAQMDYIVCPNNDVHVDVHKDDAEAHAPKDANKASDLCDAKTLHIDDPAPKVLR